MSLLNKNLLVIGGTGFIGAHLCNFAIKKGMRVSSLSLNSKGKNRDINYINADITKIKNLKDCIHNNHFDYVVNCGGYINHKSFNKGGDKVINEHLLGVYNLIKVLNIQSIKKFIQIGSSDEYGIISAPQKETDVCYPITPYAYAKYSSTKFLQMLGKNDSFNTVILRVFLTYGPGQKEDRLLPYVIKNLLKNKKVELSEGSQLRDFCYIDDICNAIFICMETNEINGEVFNICSGNGVSIRNIVENLGELVGNRNFNYSNKRVENNELWGCNKKSLQILNWEPKVNLIDGLKKTIESYS